MNAPLKTTAALKRIAVFGLGYVGIVTAACLARNGHHVIGVDVSPLKLEMIREGQSPIVEPGLQELLQEAIARGLLQVTENHEDAVLDTDISLVCVGTPSDANGGLELGFIRRVTQEIGSALKNKKDYHVVVFRSTMLPGTSENEILPLLEAESGKRAKEDFGVCMHPEFLREGSSIEDFDNPPCTVIGEIDARSGEVLASLYDGMAAPLLRTDLKTAEMAKYVSNIWHALKISFANEVGNFCKRHGIDSHKVMEIFITDKKLNISTAYLKPGFAFGGSCLPKDVRAFLHRARSVHLALPILEAILPSNELQVRYGLEMIMRTGKKRIGVLGLSFKENTDDLRESPLVLVIETLIGKGFDVKVYDADISWGQIMGANLTYIEQTIPHIISMMCNDVQEVVEHSEVLVVGKNSPQIRTIIANLEECYLVVDLVRVFKEAAALRASYEGICW